MEHIGRAQAGIAVPVAVANDAVGHLVAAVVAGHHLAGVRHHPVLEEGGEGDQFHRGAGLELVRHRAHRRPFRVPAGQVVGIQRGPGGHRQQLPVGRIHQDELAAQGIVRTHGAVQLLLRHGLEALVDGQHHLGAGHRFLPRGVVSGQGAPACTAQQVVDARNARQQAVQAFLDAPDRGAVLLDHTQQVSRHHPVGVVAPPRTLETHTLQHGLAALLATLGQHGLHASPGGLVHIVGQAHPSLAGLQPAQQFGGGTPQQGSQGLGQLPVGGIDPGVRRDTPDPLEIGGQQAPLPVDDAAPLSGDGPLILELIHGPSTERFVPHDLKHHQLDADGGEGHHARNLHQPHPAQVAVGAAVARTAQRIHATVPPGSS